MGLPVRDQLKYWGVAAVIFMVLLWYLGDVILPFVLGGAIAYFLDPVADRLELAGFSRAISTTIITLTALLIFVIMALLVVPTLVEQAISLINIAPKLAQELQAFLTEKFPSLMDADSTVRKSLLTIGEKVQERGGELLNTVLSSAASIINIVLLFVIVPVVAFYLLFERTVFDVVSSKHMASDVMIAALGIEK